MKKVFLPILAVAMMAMAITSCSNTERCWKGKMTISYEGEKESTTIYTWGTEDEVNAALDEWKDNVEDYGYYDAKYTIEKYKASEDDCEDKNDFVELDDFVG